MKKTQLFIFDLDDTVIDSSHRATLTVVNGQVELDLMLGVKTAHMKIL